VVHRSFASSLKIIEEVARAGKGRILTDGTPREGSGPESDVIRSRICVPMILRDKTVGVLYHDNRLLSSAFRESDLDLLSYFAALAAFALDNARAYEEIQRLNRKLSEENLYYKEEHLQNLHFEDIIGESPGIRRVLAQIDQVTGTDATVMIIGETGVGKELVARAIHRHSTRRDKPFIKVNCSALPESLIPSELFGHEKGAFTGAVSERPGRFELAHQGTLLLDEVGEIPLPMQAKLLRVLQEGEFERVGSSRMRKVDVRVLASTNRSLTDMVAQGRFREDLFYRLNVVPIQLPPLRERKGDIPLLVQAFFDKQKKKINRPELMLDDAVVERLTSHLWPGNIRELENLMERLALLAEGPSVSLTDLPSEFAAPAAGVVQSEMEWSESGLKDLVRRETSRIERDLIVKALQNTDGNVTRAAQLLRISRKGLQLKMKELGLRDDLEET
jgi:transcriptional regulator with GAF, ATPase, and Fis domain